MKLTPLVLGVLLAAGSFAFARHQYISERSITFTNPLNKDQSKTITSPVTDDLFGNWMKDKWVFAIAVPAVLIIGGAAASVKK